ncbi:MAG: hypothetical protein ACRCZF_00050 [Gemmataceae bacterium]
MYRAVYFHKTTRAAEVMLKLLFQRYKALIASNEKVVPEAPKAFAAAFRSNTKMPLTEYLQLDDHSVTEFMKVCRNVDDTKLKELAVGILDRRLYKAVDATDAGSSRDDLVESVRSLIESKGYSTVESWVKDTPSDTPYKPYDPDGGKPNDQIYIEDSLGSQVEFSTISNPVTELKKRYSMLRYYFPPELQTEIRQIAKNTLKRD